MAELKPWELTREDRLSVLYDTGAIDNGAGNDAFVNIAMGKAGQQKLARYLREEMNNAKPDTNFRVAELIISEVLGETEEG